MSSDIDIQYQLYLIKISNSQQQGTAFQAVRVMNFSRAIILHRLLYFICMHNDIFRK